MNNIIPDLNPENLTSGVFWANEKLVEQLFRTYYSPLCRTVNRFVNDRDAAKDIVQEVFLKMWQNREKLDPGKSLKSYLYKSAINAALNYLKKNKRNIGLDADKIDPSIISTRTTEEKYVVSELQEKINQAIDKLPEGCRAVFILSRYEDMSYKEIAAYLQISPKTVENQVGKALGLMRDYLAIYLNVLLIYMCITKIFFARA